MEIQKFKIPGLYLVNALWIDELSGRNFFDFIDKLKDTSVPSRL